MLRVHFGLSVVLTARADVQHSNGPVGGSLPARQLQYEGFEPTPHEQEDSQIAFENVRGTTKRGVGCI